MRHRRNPRPSGFFRGDEPRRLMLMVSLLVLVGFAVTRARDPSTWRWLVSDRHGADASAAESSDAAGESAPPSRAAEVDPKSTDQDADEAASARKLFEALSDRTPLGPEEMPAYWRLMKWSNSQSFAEMQRRARRDVLYTQLWEQPEKHRGELIALRLHLQRAVTWEAPENSADIKTVYEAWGATDESRTLPYEVVFSELPPGMPLGPDIREEATFVGYFLKTMSYRDGLDQQRAAPLLIGRLKWHGNLSPVRQDANQSDVFWLTLLAGGAILAIAIGFWTYRRYRKPRGPVSARAAVDDGQFNEWLSSVEQAISEEDRTQAADDDAT